MARVFYLHETQRVLLTGFGRHILVMITLIHDIVVTFWLLQHTENIIVENIKM
jgi:hypothetical protein